VNGERAGPPVDPNAARSTARGILGSRRFRSSPTPRPLRGPLNWLGDRLKSVTHGIGNVFSHIPSAFGLVIALVVVFTAIGFIIRTVGERRGRVEAGAGRAHFDGDAGEDPAALEREADAAERAGELDRAVRLRFRAGLLRLGERGAIRYRPSVTTNEVRRVLGSATFDELARTFEAIAYGGRDAGAPDVDAARREWPQVVAGAARSPDGGNDREEQA